MIEKSTTKERHVIISALVSIVSVAIIALVVTILSLPPSSRTTAGSNANVYIPSNTSNGNVDMAAVFELERGACQQQCPVYTLSFYQDGRIVFVGTENVAVANAEVTVPVQNINTLIERFRTSGFSEFEDYTANDLPDQPTSVITFRDGGQTHTVEYSEGDVSVPYALLDLGNALDALANTRQWL